MGYFLKLILYVIVYPEPTGVAGQPFLAIQASVHSCTFHLTSKLLSYFIG